MDNSQQSTDLQTPNSGAARPSWLRRQRKWALLELGLLVIVVIAGALFLFSRSETNSTPSGQEMASDKLFTALENAASQQRLQVAMYRQTFANRADAAARKNVGHTASSVVELDTTNGNYRSVFADDYLYRPGFNVGRCQDGVTYISDYQYVNKQPRATSLRQVSGHLRLLPKGHLSRVTEPLVNISCPNFGILPNALPDFAQGRMSDGVFPVTLSKEQAAAWRQRVVDGNLFTVKDEGIVQHEGRQLKKVTITPADEKTINQKLYDIFYDVADIETVQRDRPDAGWQHAFLSINPGARGSVGGFYLIDEQRNLPVYSELYSTDTDRAYSEGKAAYLNIARTKQSYQYPQALTLTLDTPLQFLE